MKTCKVCGALVDDREWNCPECGATMITSSGALSLKAAEPEKKKSSGNRMGTTVSTGSGLTDILRADNDDYGDYGDSDDGFGGGSIPVSLSKNIIEEEEQRRKAKAHRQLVSNIFKLVALVVAAFAVYMFVTKVVMKDRGASTYEALVDIYVEAANNGDEELMLTIVPQFINYRTDEAAELVADLEGITITAYDIKGTEEISSTDMDLLRDEIKLDTGKNANLNEGLILDVQLTGKDEEGLTKTVGVKMEVYRVKDKWFLYPADYEAPIF